jgi:hypothetical protein
MSINRLERLVCSVLFVSGFFLVAYQRVALPGQRERHEKDYFYQLWLRIERLRLRSHRWAPAFLHVVMITVMTSGIRSNTRSTLVGIARDRGGYDAIARRGS